MAGDDKVAARFQHFAEIRFALVEVVQVIARGAALQREVQRHHPEIR